MSTAGPAWRDWPVGARVVVRRSLPEGGLGDVLGDLLEACRLIALAAAPFMPATAPRVLAQLGYPYAFGDDGNGGPPLLDELRWGAHAGEAGSVATAEPLFPRLEGEAVDSVPG